MTTDRCDLPPSVQKLIKAIADDASRLDQLLQAAGDGQADVTLYWQGRRVVRAPRVTVG